MGFTLPGEMDCSAAYVEETNDAMTIGEDQQRQIGCVEGVEDCWRHRERWGST
jgi:hypothetical protein